MKLVVFNILVAVALAYLFLGENNQMRMKNHFDWAKDKVDHSISKTELGQGKINVLTDVSSAPNKQGSESLKPSEPLHNAGQSNAQTEQQELTDLSMSDSELKSVKPLEDTDDWSNDDHPNNFREQNVSLNRGKNPTAPSEALHNEINIPRTEDKSTSLEKPSKLSPEIKRRRELVLSGRANKHSDNTGSHEQKPDASQRRTSLRLLAEDMEILFVDKTVK